MTQLNQIPVIIQFDDTIHIDKIIIMIPRSTFLLELYLYVRKILSDKLKFEINDTKYIINLVNHVSNLNMNIDVDWHMCVGVFFDTLLCYDANRKYIDLICSYEYNEKKNIQNESLITQSNVIKQHRYKTGLANIFNSCKYFMDIQKIEMDKCIEFCSMINYNPELAIFFDNWMEKIYTKKPLRIPIAFHNKNKIDIYCPKIIKDETLYQTILRSGFGENTIEFHNLIINGLSKNYWKDVPTIWAAQYLCLPDLYIHVVYYV